MNTRIFAAGLIVLASAGGAVAQGASPFASLAGNWSGGGTIAMNDGHSEKIRCKADYEVAPSGIIMHQNLRCASDSYKFEVRSSLQADGNQILGHWSETTRQVQGDVTGSISGGSIQTSVKGTGFSATLNVQTKGNGQAVQITPQGTDIKSVLIEMRRA